MVGKVATADKSFHHPSQPKARAFAVLNNVSESLVALWPPSLAGWNRYILGAKENFCGKIFVERLRLVQIPGEEPSHVPIASRICGRRSLLSKDPPPSGSIPLPRTNVSPPY